MRLALIGLGLITSIAANAQPIAPIRPGLEPPRPPVSQPTTPAERLNRLFERLAAAKDATEGKAIAEQIERFFERSGSDTADLLMERVKVAITRKEHETALDLLDFVVVLQPKWAEAYHKRATVHFVLSDEEAAMRDLRMTLSLEPRHLSALAGLGAILQSLGQRKQAYAVLQRVLELYPQFEDVRSNLDRLKPEIEGQDL